MKDHRKANKDFIAALMTDDTLQVAVEWIRDNLIPQDVFRLEDLQEWAEDIGYAERGEA